MLPCFAGTALTYTFAAIQVLHNCPEFGGEAVQEPTGDAPGVYVGMPPDTHRIYLSVLISKHIWCLPNISIPHHMCCVMS